MARLYADEHFPFPVVELLRQKGHDVLTVQEAGKAGLRIPDDEVLAFATSQNRAVLTLNRYDFKQLHQSLVICKCSWLKAACTEALTKQDKVPAKSGISAILSKGGLNPWPAVLDPRSPLPCSTPAFLLAPSRTNGAISRTTAV